MLRWRCDEDIIIIYDLIGFRKHTRAAFDVSIHGKGESLKVRQIIQNRTIRKKSCMRQNISYLLHLIPYPSHFDCCWMLQYQQLYQSHQRTKYTVMLNGQVKMHVVQRLLLHLHRRMHIHQLGKEIEMQLLQNQQLHGLM